MEMKRCDYYLNLALAFATGFAVAALAAAAPAILAWLKAGTP